MSPEGEADESEGEHADEYEGEHADEYEGQSTQMRPKASTQMSPKASTQMSLKASTKTSMQMSPKMSTKKLSQTMSMEPTARSRGDDTSSSSSAGEDSENNGNGNGNPYQQPAPSSSCHLAIVSLRRIPRPIAMGFGAKLFGAQGHQVDFIGSWTHNPMPNTYTGTWMCSTMKVMAAGPAKKSSAISMRQPGWEPIHPMLSWFI